MYSNRWILTQAHAADGTVKLIVSTFNKFLNRRLTNHPGAKTGSKVWFSNVNVGIEISNFFLPNWFNLICEQQISFCSQIINTAEETCNLRLKDVLSELCERPTSSFNLS